MNESFLQWGEKSPSSRILSCLVVLLLPSWSMAQSECSSIENDVERLACFDGFFDRTEDADLDPETVFAGLRDLASRTPNLSGVREQVVDFQSDYLDMAMYGNSCELEIVHIVPATGRRGSDPFGTQRLLGYDYTYVGVDLRRVEDSRGGTNGIATVSMERDATIPRVRFRTDPSPEFSTDLYDQIVIVGRSSNVTFDSDRTQSFAIAAEPEDALRAHELFSSLIETCRSIEEN